MNKINFYDINKDYISYLKTIDNKIPNISYSARDKFVCGVIFNINSIDYYAPISSFKIQQKSNFIIKNDKGENISSIRLSFMFPADLSQITKKDFSKENIHYKRLLQEEYAFCNRNYKAIITKANYVYEKVVIKKNELFIKNCCNFKLLEQKYKEFQFDKQEQNLSIADKLKISDDKIKKDNLYKNKEYNKNIKL